jgi:hypothetical protein
MVGLRRAVPLTAQAYVGPSNVGTDGCTDISLPPIRALGASLVGGTMQGTELVYVAWRSGRGNLTIRIAVAPAFCSRLSEPHCAD